MSNSTATSSDLTHRFVLSDGRTISYGLYGADAGPLVVVLDGPGSRGLGRAMSPAAARLGIKLLLPDRGGFGHSTPTPGRSFAEVANDLLALVDLLAVRRFGIVAQSGGHSLSPRARRRCRRPRHRPGVRRRGRAATRAPRAAGHHRPDAQRIPARALRTVAARPAAARRGSSNSEGPPSGRRASMPSVSLPPTDGCSTIRRCGRSTQSARPRSRRDPQRLPGKRGCSCGYGESITTGSALPPRCRSAN